MSTLERLKHLEIFNECSEVRAAEFEYDAKLDDTVTFALVSFFKYVGSYICIEKDRTSIRMGW